MIKDMLPDGKYLLSGVDEYQSTNTLVENINGVVLILNGEKYIMAEDQCDGYRSYGVIFKDEDVECINTFPPQEVIIESKLTEIPGDFISEVNEMMTIKNPFNNEVIIELGTENMDDWYPMGIFHYYPENLPINKSKKTT